MSSFLRMSESEPEGTRGRAARPGARLVQRPCGGNALGELEAQKGACAPGTEGGRPRVELQSELQGAR